MIRKLQFNPFQASVLFYIEASHLICRAKQMTCFYYEMQHCAEIG